MGDNPVTVCQCQERHHASGSRSRMLIISSVVQWMLMLTIIVYLATQQLHTAQVKEKLHNSIYIFTKLRIEPNNQEHSKTILINKDIGNMDVKNGSVVIPVDGQYLLYFEGVVDDDTSNTTVTVHVKRPHEKSNMSLFSERISNGVVRAMALKDLKYRSEIYVEKSSVDPKIESFNLNIFLLGSNSQY